jgi:hypothetical protein
VALPVPWWIEVLYAAEEWGMPPWEIIEDQGKTVWFIRWRVWRNTMAKARNDKGK